MGTKRLNFIPFQCGILLVLGGLAGCHLPEPAHPEQKRTIAVGQPWAQAMDVAVRAGYLVHDTADLEIDPAPHGFYLDLPGRRALLVFRDPEWDKVKSIECVQNWTGPKGSRVYNHVKSFDVPMAEASPAR